MEQKVNYKDKCPTCGFSSGNYPDELLCNVDNRNEPTQPYSTCKHYEQIQWKEEDDVYLYLLIIAGKHCPEEKVVCVSCLNQWGLEGSVIYQAPTSGACEYCQKVAV